MTAFALALVMVADANLSLLRPASSGDGLLTVEGVQPRLEAAHPLELQLGLDGSYLPVRQPGSRIETRLGGWAQLYARLDPSFSVFAQLPVTMGEHGDISPGFGVGDIRIGLRRGFTQSLAALLAVEVDTAKPGTMTGDGRLVVEGLVSGAARRGPFDLLGNAFLRLRPPRAVGGTPLGSELGVRGGASWPLAGRASAFGELELHASLRQVTQEAWPIEWRIGARACASESVMLDAGLGTRLDNGLGAPSLRGVIAVRYAPARCKPPEPIGPEPADLAVVLAQARAERERRERESAILGLLPLSEGDARDAAALLEAVDLLAGSEADARARLAAFAEEDLRDTDGDGVPDRIDNCPREPGPASNHGCPIAHKQVVVLREDRIDILEKVNFATGKARIQKRSFPLLGQVARVLKQHPDLLKLEVQGHTDARGSAQLNTALSQARAAAVMTYLVRQGVAASRLTARGYGPSRPIAPDTTRKGREQNRRVEFRVLQRRVAREVIEIPQ